MRQGPKDNLGSSIPPRPPRLVPGALYSRQDILANLKIAKATLTRWAKLQTDPLRPVNLGTNTHFYLADEVIRFFATHRDLIQGSEE